MANRDARSRSYESRVKAEKQKYEEELASAERKWEFRYNNQDKRLKELEATVKKLRRENRELKNAIRETYDGRGQL